MLTRSQRVSMAEDIIAAMRKSYEESGDVGDFDDGHHYLRDVVSEEELLIEHKNWCQNK